MIDIATREAVRRRAGARCEYCLLLEDAESFALQIEHIIAKQHGGPDAAENLALACNRCNLHKGPNLAGIDPADGALVALFHPRRDVWIDHFEADGPRIVGRSPTGRATVRVLAMNDERRVARRILSIRRGDWP